MKARLVPLYFQGKRDEEFDRQVNCIKELLKEEAEILEPVALGNPLPMKCRPPVLSVRLTRRENEIDIPSSSLLQFGTVYGLKLSLT